MLDLRIPMGLMFSIVGGMLVLYGLLPGGSEIYRRSLEINVNLWWGMVLLAFGLIMFGVTYLDLQGKKDSP